MESKPPDLTPENSVSLKRGRFDTTKSPTMVYVRRKIDHDQPNKPNPSSETAKNGEGGTAKEPNLMITEEKKDPDLECHEPNLEAESKEPNLRIDEEKKKPDLKCHEPSFDAELKEPNGIADGKKEPDLECHEPNLEAELNELKGATENLVENKEDSTLNPKGEKIESQSDSESSKMKVGASVNLADVATEPKLESELHELDVAVPMEVTNGEKEPNLSPNEEKSEPDLVCHETNLDADLIEANGMASNQVTSVRINNNDDLQQLKISVPNQVTNGNKDNILSGSEPKLGSFTPKQAMTDANNRPRERENFRERFAKLQAYLKECDRSRQDDYIRMLRSLSAVGRSKHASELEKRAMDLLMEEGKELRRTNGLHILGKDWLKDKMSGPAQTNFRRQL